MKQEQRFLKGAFIEVSIDKGTPYQPIYFQFNPETVERTKSGVWTSAQSQRQKVDDAANEKAFKNLKGKKVKAGFVPSPEKINLTLHLDSTEKLFRNPKEAQVDISQGILPELSALESLMRKATAQVAVAGSKNAPTLVRTKEVPLVLFMWGPYRVIPVTVLSMTITEQQFDPSLNPTRAEIKVTLQVLEEEDAKLNENAFKSYRYTEAEKEKMKARFLQSQQNANKGMPVPSGYPVTL